ncbi:hypothetical protein [Rhodoferax sp. BAB1]|uniref:hypothetical protein n=1 Tax=Rhodoferax sp. BAB1 TaxID=2741720 RepID=UPI001576E60F|nr:hypothetical protein [Rhodoferax sp. BAB1]QKO23398.1 hypothetical protein HTY51_16595 [Rhodoferax sp. BAB1]
MTIPTHSLSFGKLLPWTMALLASSALAQTAAEQKPLAPPAQLSYTSPLNGYQAYTDQPVQSWQEANDTVGRIGGWRTYAREARTADPAKDGAPAATAHEGHHGGSKP